uniref:Uncharacterized protein n=1 Tax=Oryza rufipogon TaxID=4529 RepID=A0A0E0QKX9_ORYRU
MRRIPPHPRSCPDAAHAIDHTTFASRVAPVHRIVSVPAPRPELEVGGSGGRAVLPPSPLRESRTAGRWEPRIEHLQASPTASRPCFVRTEPRAAELRHPAVSRSPEILRVSARQLPSSPPPSRLGPTTPAAPSRASASLGNG